MALKQLHIRANTENDRLNEVNEGLKKEIKTLNDRIINQVNANALAQRMVGEAYTQINQQKEDYITIIQGLESELQKLKDE